ncbi:hypothetical protein ACEN9J_01070 [Variovorax sp. Varisp41]|nr:hypothetical protein [Variovorax sp. CY25R-8]MCT8180307.1 hypothetical protein [Variovorax sp. CY25R-8]
MKSSTPAIDPRSSAASTVPASSCIACRARPDFRRDALHARPMENRR